MLYESWKVCIVWNMSVQTYKKIHNQYVFSFFLYIPIFTQIPNLYPEY